MTQSNVNYRDDHVGDGATAVFAYTFLIQDEAEICVVLDNVVQTLDVDYTLSGVGDAGGGNVTFLVTPDDEAIILFLLRAPFTQLLDLVTHGPFEAEELEAAFDKIVRMCLSLYGIFGVIEADAYVKWHQNGKELVPTDTTDTGFYERFGPFNPTTASFTHAITFATEADTTQYMVEVMTNWQTTWCIPDGTKATTGFTIEFGTAAPSDAEIYVRVYINDT